MSWLQSLFIILQVGCFLDSVLSVHECKIRVQGYTGSDSDTSGFIEIDDIVVKRFSETSSDPDKNGFHAVTIDWFCHAIDIQSFPLDPTYYNLTDPDALMDYFMNVKYGHVMAVACGLRLDVAITGLLKQVFTTIGVNVWQSIMPDDSMVFVARRAFPHQTVQRVIPDGLGPQPPLEVVVTQWTFYRYERYSDCFPSLPTLGNRTAYTSEDFHHFPKLNFGCSSYIVGWEYILGEQPQDVIVTIWDKYMNLKGKYHLHFADLKPLQYGRYFINHEYFDYRVKFSEKRIYVRQGYSVGFHYPSASSTGQALLLWGDSRQTYWDQSHLGQSYFDAVRGGRTYSNKYSGSIGASKPDGYIRGLPTLRPIMSKSSYDGRVQHLTADPAGTQLRIPSNIYQAENVGTIVAETLYVFQTSFKFDGYVIGIEYHRVGPGEFYLAVYNRKFELTSKTTISTASSGEKYVRIPDNEKLDVRPGNYLGIGFPTGKISKVPIAAAKSATAKRIVWTVSVSGLSSVADLPAKITSKKPGRVSELAFRLFYYTRYALDDDQLRKPTPNDPFMTFCYSNTTCYAIDSNMRCVNRKCQCRYGMSYDSFHAKCIWEANFAYRKKSWINYFFGQQSSRYTRSTSKLTDGITESGFQNRFSETTCIEFPNLMKPWFVVDLGHEVDVSVVDVTPFDIRELDSYIEIYKKTFSGVQYVIRPEDITDPSGYISMANFLPKQIDSVKVYGPEAWWLVDTDTDSCSTFSKATWITLTRGTYDSTQLGAVGADRTDCIRKIPTFYVTAGSRCLTVNEDDELVLEYNCNTKFYFVDQKMHMLENLTNSADRCAFAPDLTTGTKMKLSACTTQIQHTKYYSGFRLKIVTSGQCLRIGFMGILEIGKRSCTTFGLKKGYPVGKLVGLQGATTRELSIDINDRCSNETVLSFKSSFPRVPNLETKIAGQDPVDYAVYVSDVDRDGALFKVCRNSFDNSTAVEVKVAWRATLEHLHDIRIGVGPDKKEANVESDFKTCATISGPLRSGVTNQINCTQIHRGKSVVIHFIGNKDLSTRESMWLCEVQVRGNPVVMYGAPCDNDSICTMDDDQATPVGDEHMVCRENLCVCDDEFYYDSSLGRCVSYDKCAEPNNCTINLDLKPHAHCKTAEATYECTCDDGFEWDKDINECTNVNECLDENGECEDLCIDFNPDFGLGLKYACDCKNKKGHKLAADKKACTDINECMIGIPTYECGQSGPVNSRCRNLPGSYECYCDDGWMWNSSTSACDNVDECATHNGGCEDECVDDTPGYNCTCENMGVGYEISGHYCKDIDECVRGTGVCQNGKPPRALCVNTPGSYYCLCEEGWEWNSTSEVCNVQSECDDDNGGCSHICKKMGPGEYECSCRVGYELESNDHTCADTNECRDRKACPRNSKCMNTIGSYWCKCDKGWRWNTTSEECDNIDECERRNGGCSQECEDLAPGYRCTCRPGFKPDDEDDHICNDINECELPNICLRVKHADCQNSVGSYRCVCHKGWKWNPKYNKCDAFSECQEKNGGCNHICKDIVEGYECSCKDGYTLGKDNHTCFDIDECASANECKGVRHARCSNTLGSYRCICDEGWKWNGTACLDINECSVKNGGCQDECVNDEPGYHCTCTNMGRGYKLKMPHGHICEDIDECEAKTGDCQTGKPIYAVCTNTPGSYTCTCQEGWKWITRHKRCENINECLDDNGDCSHICHDMSPGYVCKCPHGYELQKDLHSCADKNECAKPNDCRNPATCVNDIGSYHCICPSGYQWNATARKCQDINECATANGNCWHLCINTPGSRMCACKDGWRLLDDKQSCDDKDECADDNGDCQHRCINMAGTYRCECNKGYVQLESDSEKCRDLDECTEIGIINGGCAHKCINKQPGYRCKCKEGYRLEANNKTCVDIDECREGTHGCEYDCENKAGSYVCICAPDKTFNPSTKTCIDLFALEFTVFTTGDYLPVFADMNDMLTVALKKAIHDAIEDRIGNALFDFKYRQIAISSFKASGKGKMGVVWKAYFDKELSLKEISQIFPFLWKELTKIEYKTHKGVKHTIVAHPHPRVEFNKPDGEHLAIVMDDPSNVCGPYNYLDHCEDNEICQVENGYPICKCKDGNCKEEKKGEGLSTLELILIISFSAVAFLLLLTLCACFMWRTKPWHEAREHVAVPISQNPRYYGAKPMHPSMQPWNTNFRQGYSAGFPRHVF